MDFANQRKAYLLRTVQHMSYERIAERVVNIGGAKPSWGAVRDLCQGFSMKKACRPYKYKKCGRKPWKLTGDIQTFVLKRLLADRIRSVVTSTSLAEDVAKAKGVIVEASCIRKLLARKGYRWLPRATKRKYSPAQKQARLRFAVAVKRLSKKALRHKLAMALDGVVLSMPPADATERHNYCVGAFHYMWRKPGEADRPHLAGADKFEKQVPLDRAIPLWGGISEDGFQPVLWHRKKKVDNTEWAAAVREGKLSSAIRKLNPRRRSGPWTVLCDNESFLRVASCIRAYAQKRIALWDVPAKSPDLNPVEMFWGWARRQLRLKDLRDLKMKRPPLSKTAYVRRVKAMLRGAKAQKAAKQFARKFRGTCLEVIKRKGAAARN